MTMASIKKMGFCTKLLAAILAWLPAGCAGKPPTVAEVTGRWIADPASMHFIKGAGASSKCEITFNADGTFVTPGVPDYLVTTSDRASGALISGKGQWSLIKHYGDFVVRLDFREMDGKKVYWGTSSLISDISKSGAKLFCWIGEEGGNRFEFRRAK